MINLRPDIAAAAIQKFLADAERSNHRYRSWNHCYLAFRNARKQKSDGKEIDKDLLSLHLSCYLSSWGMFRNSFLLDRDYRTHLGIVDILLDDEDIDLLCNFPRYQDDEALNAETLQNYWNMIKTIREEFVEVYDVTAITETLVSKILLGTCGCIPAYDRFYKSGVGKFGGTQYLGLNSYSEIVRYYWSNQDEICSHLVGASLVNQEDHSTPYPSMKLMDMCFWQIGNSIEFYNKNRGVSSIFSKLSEENKYAVLHSLLESPVD